jgi:hypothetical protein
VSGVVVDTPAEMTPAWLSDVLGLDVVTVDPQRIGTGQMGTTYRLSIRYAGEAGPPTLVVKVAGPDEAMRALVAPGHAAEVGFYQHVASGLDARLPRCWSATITEDRSRFTLVLDDGAPAEPGVQADGCSLIQAEAAIANLVGVHVPRWGDPTLLDLPFLMRPQPEVAPMLKDALVGATDAFLSRYEGQLDDDDPATLRAVAGVIDRWQLIGLEPSSVVHGDYRLDNLLFSPDGHEVIAVDWQSAAVGPPLRDVAYFLGTSLEPSVRRASERSLVAGYHAAVVRRGVTGYDADRCWDDYRLGQLQAPLITILGCMYASGERTEQSDAMFIAMASRSATAIRELGSLDILEAAP